MASSSLAFQTDGLYIILTDRADSFTFHWGFYISKSDDEGLVLQIINSPNDPDEWKYEILKFSRADLFSTRKILVALQIGVLDPILHESLADRLAQIPIEYSTRFHEDMTCRVWIKEALFALDQEGYIKLHKSADDIEEEAKFKAMMNKSQNVQTAQKSTGTLE